MVTKELLKFEFPLQLVCNVWLPTPMSQRTSQRGGAVSFAYE